MTVQRSEEEEEDEVGVLEVSLKYTKENIDMMDIGKEKKEEEEEI